MYASFLSIFYNSPYLAKFTASLSRPVLVIASSTILSVLNFNYVEGIATLAGLIENVLGLIIYT